MEHDAFIGRVQKTAELNSPDEAAAVRATLGTLGEMLSPKERRDLAAQLTRELKECLSLWIERPPRERTHPHRFGLEEFYHRVAARSEVRYPAAVKHSLAVVRVLKEAVSEGELQDILHELPDEYEELLSGRPRSPVSPSITPQS